MLHKVDSMIRESMRKHGTNMSMLSIPNRSGWRVLGPGSHTGVRGPGTSSSARLHCSHHIQDTGYWLPKLSSYNTILGLSHAQEHQKIDSKSQLIP